MYQISISPEEIERKEMKSFPGKITVIDSTGPEFTKAIAYLRRQKILGFDTESRPCFSPGQPHYGVSLLQLSGPERAFLFRIKKTGMSASLCRILSNPSIKKIGAATADDVRGLQKYTPFEASGFIDLQKMVWEYGIKDKSVKKMAAIILDVKISKTQQLSNWEADELSESQQKYAATDAWICREMYLKLLCSEKNPLTPEQMMPAPPAPKENSTENAENEGNKVNAASSSEPSKKKKRRKRRAPSYYRRRSRQKKTDNKVQ
ncbi:MAG: 3'-5' exonuclease domain-containing protein 2 [Bacteroidales bacterium]|nr:3'-5' exonuclease domain-containing protein 2 [Bacteroidales bacterium]